MTQAELMSYINTNMMRALHQRERINSSMFPEEHGYWCGRYCAFEELLRLLSMVDICTKEAYSPPECKIGN